MRPKNPALHLQAAAVVLAINDWEFNGHDEQAVAPVTFEYVAAKQLVHAALPVVDLKAPPTQGVHGPPLGPVYPTLQMQAVTAVLEMGELLFVGHDKQVVIFRAPSVAEYVVTGHVRQTVATVAPTAVEYVPAAQLVHNAGPVPSL